jgi:hypothetical protein
MTETLSTQFAVVWIDPDQGKIYKVSEDRMERATLKAADLKPGASLYREIATSLGEARRILILGPGSEKSQLRSWLETRLPEVGKRIIGCEYSEHPTDSEIATYAVKYFQRPVA